MHAPYTSAGTKAHPKRSTLQQISLRGGQHKEMKARKRHLCWLWV